MADSITRKNIDLDTLDYYDGKIKNYVDNKVGTGSLTIDDTLSDTSTNPVQNKVVKQAIDNKADSSHTHVKADITDFPASLPANGGDADTVDGKHASDFMPINGEVRKYGLIRMNSSDGIRVRHIDGNDTEFDGALYLNYNSPNAPIYMNGGNTAIHSGNIGSQSVSYSTNAGNANTVGGIVDAYHLGTFSATGDGHGTAWQLYCQHNIYSDGRFGFRVGDGSSQIRCDYATNADTLDGLHASDIITSSKPYVTGTGVPVYSGGSYIVTTNHGFMPSAVMWWTNVSSGSKYEDIHPANSFNNTQFETTSYESSSSTRPVYYIIFK